MARAGAERPLSRRRRRLPMRRHKARYRRPAPAAINDHKRPPAAPHQPCRSAPIACYGTARDARPSPGEQHELAIQNPLVRRLDAGAATTTAARPLSRRPLAARGRRPQSAPVGRERIEMEPRRAGQQRAERGNHVAAVPGRRTVRGAAVGPAAAGGRPGQAGARPAKLHLLRRAAGTERPRRQPGRSAQCAGRHALYPRRVRNGRPVHGRHQRRRRISAQDRAADVAVRVAQRLRQLPRGAAAAPGQRRL